MSALKSIGRREFLRRTGLASGALVLSVPVIGGGRLAFAETSGDFAPNVYVNLRQDGTVEIVCHRSEMGQGIRTSLPQVIADEMEADWDRIELKQAVGDPKYGDQNTDGSTSIRNQFDMLRKAGATARAMLENAAAKTWQVPVSECNAHHHAVHHAATGRSLGYGDLSALAAGMEVPEEVKLKPRSQYRYIGKPVPLIDGRALTTGSGEFGMDVRLPGMLVASIERCPAVGGSVKSLDDSKARAVSGVVDVVGLPDGGLPAAFKPLGGVAVLATDTWSAERGRAALKIDWDLGPNGSYESTAYRQALGETALQSGTLVRQRGDVEQALAKAATVLEASYYAPHLSQAPMEPPSALACMTEDGGCEVWAPTQDPQTARQTVAQVLGLKPEQVVVNVTLLGGGFGRKSKPDFIAEAAWLARHTGKPVRVSWTREDDIRHGYLHSVSCQYLKAGLDETGQTTAWLHRTVFPSIMATFNPAADGPSDLELGLGFVDNPLNIANMKLESGKAASHLRIGWLRSVSNVYHAFAIGSFIDELAHAAGRDSKQFLVDLIGPARRVDPATDGAKYGNYGADLRDHPIDTARLVGVVDKAADMADWNRARPAGHGLGIAVHRSFLSYVATVVEVSSDSRGRISIEEMWTVVDAGTVVNPDRVRAQMEGAGIYGLSLTLHGEITARDGAVEQGNFDDYPVLRMHEAPRAIHVHIVDSQARPGGVGEPGVPPVAPAVCNAVFAATGRRIRELPLSKSDLV
jgi:isoquinoline 1-oxidoreductase beta subunit